MREVYYFLSTAHTDDDNREFLQTIIEESIQSLDMQPVNTFDVDIGDAWAAALQRSIERADIIFVNLSTKNPNVMYEAGIATGMRKTVVYLTQQSESIPFDIRGSYFLVYNPNDREKTDELRRHIRRIVRAALPDPQRVGDKV